MTRIITVNGTYTINVGTQQKDYIQLLKIMLMVIIKMNEEFIIREEIGKIT